VAALDEWMVWETSIYRVCTRWESWQLQSMSEWIATSLSRWGALPGICLRINSWKAYFHILLWYLQIDRNLHFSIQSKSWVWIRVISDDFFHQ
jgi:hypothetical protein